MKTPLLSIQDLTIESVADRTSIVKSVSLTVSPGEVVALIGESGSGKTTLCLAALGYVRPGLRIVSGAVRLEGVPLLELAPPAMRALRGRDVAYVAQSAAASFNPSLKVGNQVIESAVVHQTMSAARARARALDLFKELALPNPTGIWARYPHQVSGGQLQRLMAAMAMCCGPKLLVLDEPTTALDVTTQMGVLKALKDAIRKEGVAALYVSHDLAVVAQIADRIIVLRDGAIQEEGPAEQVIVSPAAAYTRSLMDASHKWNPGNVPPVAAPPAQSAPLLELSGITAGYGRTPDGGPAVVAVKDVSLELRRSTVLGVIGESGSGKSSLARVVAGLLEPSAGSVSLSGQTLAPSVEMRSREELRRIQLVFQSPDVALNPAQTVDRIIGRPLDFFGRLGGRGHGERVTELLDMVQLPADFARRRPHELSGGQKQRINLARALAAQPDLILCDEVTSALDTVVSASIVKLLRELCSESGVTFLFITHDVSMVATFADEVAVMYRGEIVERGMTDTVLNQPRHAYTKVLVSSVPQLRIGWLESAMERRKEVLNVSGKVKLAD